MPGRLAKYSLSTSDEAILYSNSSNFPVTVNISVCNRSNTTSRFTIAVIDGLLIGNLTNSDYLYYNKELDPYDSLEKTGLVISKDQSIYIKSDSGNLSINISGF